MATTDASAVVKRTAKHQADSSSYLYRTPSRHRKGRPEYRHSRRHPSTDCPAYPGGALADRLKRSDPKRCPWPHVAPGAAQGLTRVLVLTGEEPFTCGRLATASARTNQGSVGSSDGGLSPVGAKVF
jgi:hypothetical protein